jgi:hypothetical protein
LDARQGSDNRDRSWTLESKEVLVSIPAGAGDTIVLVHKAGDADPASHSAQGVLTHTQAVFVPDPPENLLQGGELVAVIARHPSGGGIDQIERILVRRVISLVAGQNVVAAVFVLRSPSQGDAAPLSGQEAIPELRETLRSSPGDAGRALFEANLMSRPLDHLGEDVLALLEADRCPRREIMDLSEEPDEASEGIFCFVLKC